jgi:hypothetical protein
MVENLCHLGIETSVVEMGNQVSCAGGGGVGRGAV